MPWLPTTTMRCWNQTRGGSSASWPCPWTIKLRPLNQCPQYMFPFEACSYSPGISGSSNRHSSAAFCSYSSVLFSVSRLECALHKRVHNKSVRLQVVSVLKKLDRAVGAPFTDSRPVLLSVVDEALVPLTSLVEQANPTSPLYKRAAAARDVLSLARQDVATFERAAMPSKL
eukprot:TRINITY_DN11451_c0_g1_i4.p3 TRINITY_DN11451_c0_g1~~TRINITY_DN11451_c0_g1_i4.p3  ORF type:complete len:172 (+),score=15.67 TRINITY_DN11451_c0_g1_i4:1276-1791(+)